MFWHCRARQQWVWGGVGGSLGTYLGGCGGDGGNTAVHFKASSTASRATWYGVEVMWGLPGGLTGVGEVVVEGGEGGGVGNGGWGEAISLRHFLASQSHGGDGRSPNRNSSGRSPQPHSGNEGLEGTEEATLRGLDDMANCGPHWVGDERVGAGAGPTPMSGSETERSRPRTHFLASRGRLIRKECPMCRRGSVHTCLLCNTRISLVSVVGSMFIIEGVYGHRRHGLDHGRTKHLKGVVHDPQ